jgi:hypothetical protein
LVKSTTRLRIITQALHKLPKIEDEVTVPNSFNEGTPLLILKSDKDTQGKQTTKTYRPITFMKTEVKKFSTKH